MSNLDMQSMVNVIADVNELIAKYGINVVNHAMRYVNEFPVQKAVTIEYTDGINRWQLTHDQHKQVADLYNANMLIQSIKQFREITNAALKEAKDAVERKFKS